MVCIDRKSLLTDKSEPSADMCILLAWYGYIYRMSDQSIGK